MWKLRRTLWTSGCGTRQVSRTISRGKRSGFSVSLTYLSGWRSDHISALFPCSLTGPFDRSYITASLSRCCVLFYISSFQITWSLVALLGEMFTLSNPPWFSEPATDGPVVQQTQEFIGQTFWTSQQPPSGNEIMLGHVFPPNLTTLLWRHTLLQFIQARSAKCCIQLVCCFKLTDHYFSEMNWYFFLTNLNLNCKGIPKSQIWTLWKIVLVWKYGRIRTVTNVIVKCWDMVTHLDWPTAGHG